MSDVKPNFKSAKKKPKTPTKTRLLKQCDTLFSLLVRSAGRCSNCGKSEFLQCAHGFSRRYRAVRFDTRNAWPLCRGCHVYFTHRPLEWDEWMRSELGDLYEVLRDLALHGKNPDLATVRQNLSVQVDRLGLGDGGAA